MRLQLSLLEPRPPEDRVWRALDDEHRAQAIALLARLIAKLAAARRRLTVLAQEKNHE